jgi:DDE superfamily endonuclease
VDLSVVRGSGAHDDGRELLPIPLPGMDDICLEVFLDELSKTYYPDHHLLVVVLDGAPSHRSEQITRPENVSLIMVPPTLPYAPELDPAERGFQEFRRELLSNRTFETVTLLQKALSRTLGPYYLEAPARLQRLTGFSWWVEAVNAL